MCLTIFFTSVLTGMQDECFTVKCVTVQNCFLYLPEPWLRRLATKPNVIKLSHNNGEHYLSWHSRPSSDDRLWLSATFARSLSIKEGDKVFASCAPAPASLTNVKVVPKNFHDWEIVTLQSDKIQSILLDQINIVAKDQAITVWVSKYLCVILVADTLEPNFKYGKLEQFTEVLVSPPKQKIPKEQISQSQKGVADFGVWHRFKNCLMSSIPNSTVDVQDEYAATDYQKLLQNDRRKSSLRTFRVLSVPKIKTYEETNATDSLLRHPYHAFIQKRFWPKDFDSSIYKIRKVRENRQFVKTTSTNFLRSEGSTIPKESSELTIKLFAIEDILEKCSSNISREYFLYDTLHAAVYLSDNLRMNLKLKVGAKIIMERSEVYTDSASSIEIFPFQNSISREELTNYVIQFAKHDNLLLNSHAIIVFNDGTSCILSILPKSCPYTFLDEFSLKDLTIRVNDVIPNLCETITDSEVFGNARPFDISTGHLNSLLSECQTVLNLSLGLHSLTNIKYDRENILICGEIGSGKTTICKILKESLERAPHFVHTHMIDCKSLKGKKVEMLQKTISSAITDCVYHQPSVLFLDDLESITSSSSNEEENTPDAINAARCVDVLFNVVTEHQPLHYISTVATCTKINKIGQKLRSPRGVHFFRTVLTIPNLEKANRIDILQTILKNKRCVSKDLAWDNYGNKTEGWMAQDLVDMVEKAAFAVLKRHAKYNLKPPLTLLEDDMSSSLECFTPMSLHDVHLYKGPGHTWSDIGGLSDVKRSLIEILQWPLKYPELFKNAPTKLQGGVLLYGMPGTGKTMLAGAIAKECGLNLISVKGPELLSKYIGASEEAVRNVFERAQRAKPCVLFFDEFDSLAPRRGHDSTGVTDRVVNQLLTQLDGVEEREGVAVVAASSRPDLLDPALLRPGRLDKSLLCPLPNESDREEILTALCRAQDIDTEDLDLKSVAATSSGYTGADLNAVLSQAKLTALEEVLATAPEERTELGKIKITQKHIDDSARSTHSSLTTSERVRYDRIYARFTKGDSFTDDILQSQRATLA